MKKWLKRKFRTFKWYAELELTWWEFIKIDLEHLDYFRQYCWYKSIRWSVESRINWKRYWWWYFNLLEEAKEKINILITKYHWEYGRLN